MNIFQKVFEASLGLRSSKQDLRLPLLPEEVLRGFGGIYSCLNNKVRVRVETHRLLWFST